MRGTTDKCVVVLDMYEALSERGGIEKKAYLEKYGISVPTFCRYLSTVRNYFAEKKGKKVVYRKDNNIYCLED